MKYQVSFHILSSYSWLVGALEFLGVAIGLPWSFIIFTVPEKNSEFILEQ